MILWHGERGANSATALEDTSHFYFAEATLAVVGLARWQYD